MNHNQSIVAASLFLSWAVLLSARTLAAAIYATAPAGSYKMGLVHIGTFLPSCAWLSFAGGVTLLILALRKKG